MDLNDVNTKLQELTGQAMTQEEQEAMVAFSKSVLPEETDTEVFVKRLREKGLPEEDINHLVEQAQALLSLWLLRYLFDHTSEDERKNIEIAAESLSPTQTNELIDVLMEKKIGKSFGALSDELWAKVIEAFLDDIDMLIEESKKAA